VYSKDEIKQLNVSFWSGFSLYCSKQKYLKGKRRMWMLHKTKVNHVHFRFETGRENVQVMLEILHRNEDQRLEVYEKLEQCKGIMERGFPNGLIWDFAFIRENGQEVCRIYTEYNGVDMYNVGHWETMFKFMAENMFRLESNFLEIRDLLIQ
jgi:hypothetical protein